MNWILIIVIISQVTTNITTVRVSSKQSCESIAKQLPKQFGIDYMHVCIEDKE